MFLIYIFANHLTICVHYNMYEVCYEFKIWIIRWWIKYFINGNLFVLFYIAAYLK